MKKHKELQSKNKHYELSITSKDSLSDHQRKIWEGLIKIDKRLGQLYLGSIQVLADKTNPARFILAAHGLRAMGFDSREKDTKEKTKKLNHKARIKKQIAANDPLGGAPDYILEKISKRWVKDLHKWFNKISKGFIDVSQKEFEQKLGEFEKILFSISNPHFDVINAIDQLLKIQNPKKKDVVHLQTLLINWAAYAYFFEKAKENWLAPLAREGFFTDPPSQRRWPESMYLTRVAGKKPQKVMNIIKSCPPTNNQWVYDDFVQAAMNMPSDIGVQIIPLIKKRGWLKSSYHILLPHKVAEFMVKLIEEGKINQALRLAEILTDVVRDPRATGFRDAKPIFNDEWQYKRIVEESMKDLKIKAPEKLLKIFCSRLEKALKIENKDSRNSKSFYEYSYIWRPNIETSRRLGGEDVKNVLVGAIIDLIHSIGESDKEKLIELAKIIKNCRSPIFRRIELYLYRIFPLQFSHDIQRILTDKRAIEAHNLRREYLPLLKDQFSNLDEDSQKKILNIIISGLGIKRTKDWPLKNFNRYKTNRQLLYLQAIEDKLPPDIRQWYEKKLAEHGRPYDDEGGIKSWVGPTSPVTAEELKKKTTEEIIDYLATWTPPEDKFAAPSPEGLGRIFQEIVAERHSEFSKVAPIVFEKKLRPVYIYHLFYGLEQAIKNQECFDWRPVIKLCTSIIKTEDYSDFPKIEDEFEPDWRSVRKAMASLIGDGLVFAHCIIPFNLRRQIWEIIKVVTNDKDPTPEYEQKYGGDNMDPYTLSINTVRGEAMHTLIKYALWCAKNLYPNKEAAQKTKSKLVPEAREILEFHLDPANDPSLTVRAVYGAYMPNLFYLDKAWVIQNLERIFPKDSNQRDLWMAGWESYLSNNVYSDLFNVLKDEYRRSIGLLDSKSKKGYKFSDLNERLPQHLIIAYAYDIAHDDLIDEFFSRAPAQARGEAISFVGRAILKKELTKFPEEESGIKLEKLKALWEKRLDLPPEKYDKDELKEFGWWFSRSPFSREWTITQLVRTLELTGGEIEPEHEIPKELINYVDEFPVQTISALNLVARGDKEGWKIRFNDEAYQYIIQQVINKRNRKAVKLATDLVHYLGQRGYIQYRDLLKK